MNVDPTQTDANVTRFDPVLRSLLAFGLVEPDQTNGDQANGDGHRGWHLVPAVQRRLETLVAPAPPADKLIYFGHRCSSCHEHAPTRMRGGTLLCDNCLALVDGERRPVRSATPR